MKATVPVTRNGKAARKAGKSEDLPGVIHHSALSGEKPGMYAPAYGACILSFFIFPRSAHIVSLLKVY